MAIAAASPSQKTSGSGGGPTSSVALTFPNNVTAGSLLTFVVTASTGTANDPPVAGDLTKTSGTATIGTVSLDLVDSRTIAGVYYLGVAIYSVIVTGSGSLTMTYANVGSSSYWIGGDEYTGSWDGTRVEDTASAQATSTAPSSGDATSAGAALFIGGQGMATGALAGMTPDGAFTQIAENEGSATQVQGSAIARIVASGTTDAASWTNDVNQEWLALLVVYREATGGTTITPGAGSVTLTATAPTLTNTSPVPPLIEAADCTVSGSNTASGSWAVSHPAASAGDLLIFCLGWDDSTTVSSVTAPSGPNGETLTAVNGTAVASASTEVRAQVWYTVATGSWSASTRTFTPSASESWTATVIKVPAGEFDATTPIGASGTYNADATTATVVTSPTFSAGSTDKQGRLVWMAAVDADPLSATAPTGWTILQRQDLGDVAHGVAARNAATNGSESIGSSTWSIAGDSSASVAFIVRAPVPSADTITPAAGSIVLTGSAPTVTAPVLIRPGAGALAITGAAPTVSSGASPLITPASAAIVLTGSLPVQTLTLPAPAAAAIVLAGHAPTVSVGKLITPAAGATVLTGTAPTVTRTANQVVTPGAGAVALSGATPTVTRTANVAATPGASAVVLTGTAPTVTRTANQVVTPAAGALSLSATAPDVTRTQSGTIQPAAGSLVLTGAAPVVGGSFVIRPAAGALALAGAVPTVGSTASRTITPDAGALVLTATAPTVGGSFTVRPGAGAIALVGSTPVVTVSASGQIQPAPGALVLAGAAPAVGQSYVIRPGAGALALAGAAPTVDRTAGASITPPAAAVLLSAAEPIVTRTANHWATPGAGAIVLAGAVPTAVRSDAQAITPDAAALVLTPFVPSVGQFFDMPRTARLGARVGAVRAGRVGERVAPGAGRRLGEPVAPN